MSYNTSTKARALGNNGDNVIIGGAGADTISGKGGQDTIIGGLGRDIMTGGGGLDTFVFNDVAETGATAATRDKITDFNQGEGDLIDLSAIDAGAAAPGNPRPTGGRSGDGPQDPRVLPPPRGRRPGAVEVEKMRDRLGLTAPPGAPTGWGKTCEKSHRFFPNMGEIGVTLDLDSLPAPDRRIVFLFYNKSEYNNG